MGITTVIEVCLDAGFHIALVFYHNYIHDQ